VSTSAAQAAAFFAEAAAGGEVFGIKDAGGFPAPLSGSGERAMPFWSNRSRAEKVCASVPAYEGFGVVPLPLAEWRERWLSGLARDGLRVGLNWSGARATGYDFTPNEVLARLDAHGSSPEKAR
jgi:hypothetical protein